MPRYYFDLSTGQGPQTDDEGTELTGLEQARDEALGTLLAIAKDQGTDGGLEISVRDEQGKRLVSVRMQIEISWES